MRSLYHSNAQLLDSALWALDETGGYSWDDYCLGLLEKGKELCKLTKRAPRGHRNNAVQRRIRNLVQAINELARNYPATPALKLSNDLQLKSEWSPMYEYEGYPTPRCAIGSDFVLGFVRAVLDLVATGEIDRLRQCSWCKRWMIARQYNQRLCSDKRCHAADYQSKPKVRERRNRARREKRKREAAADARNRARIMREHGTQYTQIHRKASGQRKSR